MTAVVMPTLGLTMEEGTVVRWLKAEGEAVARGEPLLVVQTEKATVEVESPVAGSLRRILVPEGETVPVSAPIAEIGDAEQPAAPAVATEQPAAPAVATGQRAAPAVATEVSAARPSSAAPTSPPVSRPAAAGGRAGRVVASPRARRAARTLAVDLSSLRGRGPNGRVVEADVVAAAGERPAPAAVRPATPMRRAIAERMAHSARTVAAVTLFMDVDATELVRARRQLAPEIERVGGRLTYDALIARACAMALAEFPDLNAVWVEGQGIRRHDRIDLGVAVALEPEGLVVPVLRDVGRKALGTLARELGALVERARAGRLAPDQMRDGTFTITNLGGAGVRAFTPIVNPGEAAILGVGLVREVPAYVDGRLEPRAEMTLSLTVDHRVVDGLPAARFLGRVRDRLERPYALVMPAEG